MSSEEYHPELEPLSWLFGVWESVDNQMTYPTVGSLSFDEVVEFVPMTEATALGYKSETWHPVKKEKLHCERGFLRFDPKTKQVALLAAHFFGLNEISEGTLEGQCIKVESKKLSTMSFISCVETLKITRKWHLEGDNLISYVEMQTSNQPLQKHLLCKYKKRS